MRRKTSAQIRRMEKRAVARGEVYTYVAPLPRTPQNERDDAHSPSNPKKKTNIPKQNKTKQEQLVDISKRLEKELKSIDEETNLVSKERRSAKRKAEAMAAEDAEMTRADFLVWCENKHHNAKHCSVAKKQGNVAIISCLLLVVLVMLHKTMAWGPPHCHINRGRQCHFCQHHISSVRSIKHGPRVELPTSVSPMNPSLPRSLSSTTTTLYGLLDFFSPYETKIPPDLVEEIYRAEANTEAAKDRGTRIFVYTLVAILGIALAFFNGFLTELRMNGLNDGAETAVATTSAGGNLDVLVQAGFGWVLENPLYKFLFTNKIGGILCLLLGSGSAILAEADYDSKRVNAEKIYEELERRRIEKTRPTMKQKQKKRQPGNEKKSLRALSELLAEEDTSQPVTTTTAALDTDGNNEGEDNKVTKDNLGFFSKVKTLYDKADSMAASQALLLNKKLEEAGVVEKITDESGLKVIGRDKARMLEQDNNERNKTDELQQ
jgi:hypothetical protein